MVQGKIPKTGGNKFGGKKRKRNEVKESKVKKHVMTKDTTGIRESNEIEKAVRKKINQHQKKIYKSIEQTIIEKAKKHRENFEII